MAMKELGVSTRLSSLASNKVIAFPLFADFSTDLCMSKDLAHKKIAVLFQIH